MSTLGWERIISQLVAHKLLVVLAVLGLSAAGIYVSPFSFGDLPRDPVAFDALPNLGENQHIVVAPWEGRSPSEIEEQVTYPLSSALLGLPGVKTVRGSSTFGVSTVYVIFSDGVELYWARARIAEKLAAMPAGALPRGVAPVLGPDANALGQVFWYTLQARGPDDKPASGWDLHERRSVQDWTVRYALQSVPGVAEVASIGGFVHQYQVELDPEALARHAVDIDEVARALARASSTAGARTLEVNHVSYMVTGMGQVEKLSDFDNIAVRSADGKRSVALSMLGHVTMGPADRQGALDDAGTESVGGVVVARVGENPLELIARIKDKIAEIAPGLPKRGDAQLKIVPFYDRSALVTDTFDTLASALAQQIIITILIVLLTLKNLRSSVLISAVLPFAVLMTFLAMKLTGVEANAMALAGIAIAIGEMVDMGVVFMENVVSHLDRSDPSESRSRVIVRAVAEVAPAVMTSVLSAIVGFLPVLALTASEGKMFRPLAYTKSFAMLTAMLIALLALPPLADALLSRASRRLRLGEALRYCAIAVLTVMLTRSWMPLSEARGLAANLLFVAALLGGVLALARMLTAAFVPALRWCLQHKAVFLTATALLTCAGLASGIGLGREFMPQFDEGSYLYMPTTAAHVSNEQALQMLRQLDSTIAALPEIERVVGKIGRAESAHDPAPTSMFETLITYKPEFKIENGERVRQWRSHIRNVDDVWTEVVHAAKLLGLSSAPMLMPISGRQVMLRSGMSAPLGVKVFGPDIDTVDSFTQMLITELAQVPAINPGTLLSERQTREPMLMIAPKPEALLAHGLSVEQLQRSIQLAVGGENVSTLFHGRARYPVHVSYAADARADAEAIRNVVVITKEGSPLRLGALASVDYVTGPHMIRSENAVLLAIASFEAHPGFSDVDAVEQAQKHLAMRVQSGKLQVPPGVSFRFAGTYEDQARAQGRLKLLVPITLAIIALLIFLQFRSMVTTLIVFSGAFICIAGGFLLIRLYGAPWFLDANLFGVDLRDVFRVHPVKLSVVVWIGFIALIGIAADTGVIIATYLAQRFAAQPPTTIDDIRESAIVAAERRLRPCLMTTLTTIIALLPVLTAHGRGADLMLPMALPSLGGMATIAISWLVVPVLYAAWEERKLSK